MDVESQRSRAVDGRRSPISGFEGRWVAEALRLRESRQGPLEDREEAAAARAAGGPREARILFRARRLGEREGVTDAVRRWGAGSRAAALLLAIAAAVGGFAAAIGTLGEGGRAVNVVWALGALLGIHVLSLALWLVGFVLSGGKEGGGALGRAWLWLSSRVATAPARRETAEALAALLARSDLARWWLGAVTHGLWACALAGALAGVLAAFAARRYGFVWETTILPADVFVRFVALAGWLPAQLGFALPEPALVRASGAVPVPDDAARLAWSSWLVGCLVAYGLLPRLALWAGCFARWRFGRSRLRLDLSASGFAELAERLMPASEHIGVIDPAPPRAGRAPDRAVARRWDGPRLAVGVELGAGLGWPPALPAGVGDLGVADTGEERRILLARVTDAAPARLLIACDARLSPDRGSLGLIAALATHAGECRVWLMQADAAAAAQRLPHWRDGLVAAGFPPQAVIEGEAGALAWLAAPGNVDVGEQA